jgi:hypothetical protein
MQGAAAGLSYLYAQTPPILHGNLKGVRPSPALTHHLDTNRSIPSHVQSSVFVSPTGTALLADIGVAMIPQPPEWSFHGIDDARWLAPEVMNPSLRPTADKYEATPDGALPATPESDVYAFGMLCYQVLWPCLPDSVRPR